MAIINTYTLHLLSESQFWYGMTDIHGWALIENINLKKLLIFIKGTFGNLYGFCHALKNKQICSLMSEKWQLLWVIMTACTQHSGGREAACCAGCRELTGCTVKGRDTINSAGWDWLFRSHFWWQLQVLLLGPNVRQPKPQMSVHKHYQWVRLMLWFLYLPVTYHISESIFKYVAVAKSPIVLERYFSPR